uniref:Uncharacterized protein n=1 Tax=Oryza glumipatula TaxID=40148 RepID=A0A0D9ZYZ6_9ORYZ
MEGFERRTHNRHLGWRWRCRPFLPAWKLTAKAAFVAVRKNQLRGVVAPNLQGKMLTGVLGRGGQALRYDIGRDTNIWSYGDKKIVRTMQGSPFALSTVHVCNLGSQDYSQCSSYLDLVVNSVKIICCVRLVTLPFNKDGSMLSLILYGDVLGIIPLIPDYL